MERVAKFLKEGETYYQQSKAISQGLDLLELHIFLKENFTYRQVKLRMFQSRFTQTRR